MSAVVLADLLSTVSDINCIFGAGGMPTPQQFRNYNPQKYSIPSMIPQAQPELAK